ncbi:MAG: SRPBCC family protein [Pseudomonadota bacterium]
MAIAKLERTLNVSRDYCWAWLADFGALSSLHPPGNLTEFSCEGSTPGDRRFARFNPELGVEEQIIERLEVVNAPHVIAYSIVENDPLPMKDYVAVITFNEKSSDSTEIIWEGHYTEAGLGETEMSAMLCNFYSLFLDGIAKAHELGRAPGETPY